MPPLTDGREEQCSTWQAEADETSDTSYGIEKDQKVEPVPSLLFRHVTAKDAEINISDVATRIQHDHRIEMCQLAQR